MYLIEVMRLRYNLPKTATVNAHTRFDLGLATFTHDVDLSHPGLDPYETTREECIRGWYRRTEDHPIDDTGLTLMCSVWFAVGTGKVIDLKCSGKVVPTIGESETVFESSREIIIPAELITSGQIVDYIKPIVDDFWHKEITTRGCVPVTVCGPIDIGGDALY